MAQRVPTGEDLGVFISFSRMGYSSLGVCGGSLDWHLDCTCSFPEFSLFMILMNFWAYAYYDGIMGLR